MITVKCLKRNMTHISIFKIGGKVTKITFKGKIKFYQLLPTLENCLGSLATLRYKGTKDIGLDSYIEDNSAFFTISKALSNYN